MAETTEYERLFYKEAPSVTWTEYPQLRLRYLNEDETVVQFNYSPDPAVEIWRSLGGYHEHEF